MIHPMAKGCIFHLNEIIFDYFQIKKRNLRKYSVVFLKHFPKKRDFWRTLYFQIKKRNLRKYFVVFFKTFFRKKVFGEPITCSLRTVHALIVGQTMHDRLHSVISRLIRMYNNHPSEEDNNNLTFI